MRGSILILFISIFAFFLSSCNSEPQQEVEEKKEISPLDRLPDNEAGDVVRKAIDFVGGWEAWENKKTFSFYKNITHVDSTGEVVRQVKQLHQYQLRPRFKARMSWEDNGDEFVIINNGWEAKKYKNGEEMTDSSSKNEAWNSSYGSNYVVSMPFKLTDPGVILTYDGVDSVMFNKKVHALKVEYEEGAGSAGGMHTWWYYFDFSNCDLVGNYLDHGKGYSFTTYETFNTVGDIRIHEKRFSNLSNAEKEIVTLKTIYENEEMKFNEALEESLFELK